MSYRPSLTTSGAHARLSATSRYAGGVGGNDSLLAKSRHVVRAARVAGRGRGGGVRRGSRRGPGLIVAKIWTDDGRRKAAEMMGLTSEVRARDDRVILIFFLNTRPLSRGKEYLPPALLDGRACPVALLEAPAHHIPPPRSHHTVPFCAQEAQDEKTLKRAFRRLALRYHPDIAKDDAGVEKFHEIQEAYRVLSGAELAHVELPQDQEWDTHDWRWAHRYKGAANGVAGIDPENIETTKIGAEEKKTRVESQLRSMAGAPSRRKRRVIKPLSKQPSPAAVGVEFNSGTYDDDGGEDCPSDGCAGEWSRPATILMNDDDEDEDGNDEKTGDTAVHTKTAYNARNVRGYQSDRHSTETAHERLNAQLAGLQRKKVIRARAMGIDVSEPKKRAEDPDAIERQRENTVWASKAARFYGGRAGLQLEESTPERFLRLAKLAKEWRDQRGGTSFSQALMASAEEKMSPKELLQSAVEGASLGACA